MKYYRNGKPSIYDPYRKILVPDLPEERTRQEFLNSLVASHGIPVESIITEYPLSRINKKSRLRADIIIWADEEKKPVLVIEVKAPKIELTDTVFEQVEKYRSLLKCPFFGITNGKESIYYHYTNGEIHTLKNLPLFNDMLSQSNLKYKPKIESYAKLSFEETIDTDYVNGLLNEDYVIGSDTPAEMYHILSELDNFLLAGTISEEFPIKISDDITILEDLGISYRSYGNAAGGSWPGQYRSFMIKDMKGDNQIYRLVVLAKGKFINDSRFGNTQSTTTLIVAVDDFDKSHNSLQLNMDKSLISENDKWIISHDGKITVGKRGAVKKDTFFDFIRKKQKGSYIINNELYLGSIPSNEELDWDNIREFIMNILIYANIREELRRELK